MGGSIPASVYRNIVWKYELETAVSAEVNGLCVHSPPATAATNTLSHEADIAKVQESLGHAKRLHHAALRSAQDAPRGQRDVSGRKGKKNGRAVQTLLRDARLATQPLFALGFVEGGDDPWTKECESCHRDKA
jgi:hypothetical protein